ncbi:unnamed protein product [Diabrotica balteata]|uniref:Uncharacterized protein n=1 Tax=Diabrotica balteata TaxID=107213 RepID=A0A9N9T4U1_DIABA|nr:unnamed protein product [Diabrotica balteata]
MKTFYFILLIAVFLKTTEASSFVLYKPRNTFIKPNEYAKPNRSIVQNLFLDDLSDDKSKDESDYYVDSVEDNSFKRLLKKLKKYAKNLDNDTDFSQHETDENSNNSTHTTKKHNGRNKSKFIDITTKWQKTQMVEKSMYTACRHDSISYRPLFHLVTIHTTTAGAEPYEF